MTVDERTEFTEFEVDQSLIRRQVAEMLALDEEAIADWRIHRIRDDGLIDADIPLDCIDVQGVPVDEANVHRLMGLLDTYEAEVGGTGQRDAVVIGNVRGEAAYMVDGFHRHAAQTVRGKQYINAVVEPDLTYEQVVKRRIEYAHTHTEIEFARQVEWMQSVWERTDWAGQLPNVLTAFRAFQSDYALHKTDDVALIDGLTDEDYQHIRHWVKTKSEEWGYTPAQIRERLALVESFDPELMKLVYQRKGTPPEGRIGLGHVEVITETYGGEFDMQKVIAEAIIAHGLTIAEAKLLIEKAESTGPISSEDLLEALSDVDIEELKLELTAKKKPSVRPNASPKRIDDIDDAQLFELLQKRLTDPRHIYAMRQWRNGEFASASQLVTTLANSIILFAGVDSAERNRPSASEIDSRALAQSLGTLSMRFAEIADRQEQNSPEALNLRQHEEWGLTFTVYPDEAPRVLIGGRGQDKLSELSAAILYVVARQNPGLPYADEDIKRWIDKLGVFDEPVDQKDVRGAIYESEGRFKEIGKERHIVLRSGGRRQVYFGLIARLPVNRR